MSIACRVPVRGVDVELEVEPGQTLALMGPNGAGKSTVLEFAAGLVGGSGNVQLGGRNLTTMATHRRNIGLLTQDALLMPHLTVQQNIAFGLPKKSKAPGGGSRESRVTTWLQRLDLTELAERKPRQLSGGQAQRVAIARALAADPDVLLLDEPMAALDVTIAVAMRAILRELLAERTCVLVTHDVRDAFELADQVAVLNHGRIVDTGPTREVLARPGGLFATAAAALDLNF